MFMDANLLLIFVLARSWMHRLYLFIEVLIQLRLRPFASALMRLVLFSNRKKVVPSLEGPIHNPDEPTGPFQQTGHAGLLLFVPRSLKSRLIDELSGRYGYSHVAVDCGEIDLPTGKPVMTESMTGVPVRRVFQERYGPRPYVYLPLERLGIDTAAFVQAVQSRLGEPYDYMEALTWGAIDDPARQVCSNLATDCLPAELRQRFAALQHAGLLPPLSVSVHDEPERGDRNVFVSPNAFAICFQAPRGRDVTRAHMVVEPRLLAVPPLEKRIPRFALRPWPAVLAGAASVLLTAAFGYLIMEGRRK
jgi:hypothetical protein